MLPLIVLALVVVFINAQQHHSFAATKFDIDPSLPVEDPIQISAQLDPKPQKNLKPQRKHFVEKPIETVPAPRRDEPFAPVLPTQSIPPSVPLRTLAPVMPTLAAFTSPTPPFGQSAFTLPTVPPFLGPPQPQVLGAPQSEVSQRFFPQQLQQPFSGFQSPSTQQQRFQQEPPLTQPFQQAIVPNPQFQQDRQFQFQQGLAPTRQPQNSNVQLIRGALTSEKVDLWFRETYDTSICKRDSRQLANQFRRKFPTNLWRNGKESLLSDLLAARLNDCFTKQESNHWRRVDDLISGLNLLTTEEEECRIGLIQEQISCDNVFSFTCQFVQKAYNFRLVPTRLIIQEARIAEDGAEKCRKVVRKIKKKLQE